MSTGRDQMQTEIAYEFEHWAAQEQSMTIASTYKSVILTQPIRVLDIMPNRVMIQVPDAFLYSTPRGKVCLYSPEIPGTIIAALVETNVIGGRIALSNLDFSDHRWKERNHNRVQPEHPIYAEMTCQHVSLKHINIVNISANGLRVAFYQSRDEDGGIERDMPIRISFRLPRDAALTRLKGKIANMQPIGKLVSAGIQFTPTAAQEERLSRYISVRRAEILHELKKTSERMLEPRQVQDLYF